MSYLEDSQKVQICGKFIQSAPPGEFNNVFNGKERTGWAVFSYVRTLLDDDNILESGVLEASAQYNKDQLLPVDLPDGTKAMISVYGEIDSNTYLDPRTSKSFTYDHIKKEASDLQSIEENATASPWRKAVETAVDGYLDEHYPTGVCAIYGSSEDDSIKVVSCIESHKFSPTNFCNGRWRSIWETVIRDGQASVTGNVLVKVHYYEDGNVHLSASKEFKASFPATNEKTLAEELVKLIKKMETEYQTSLNQNSADM
eukprot:Ihof_evm10s77 gene=Ihof_evmTU10s77